MNIDILGGTVSGTRPWDKWDLPLGQTEIVPGTKRPFLFDCTVNSVAPVRFGSVTVSGWKGSIGSGFRLHKKGSSVFQCIFKGKDGSGFGSWKTVLAVPVPFSVSGKTVLTVPVSGSGSVPEPP